MKSEYRRCSRCVMDTTDPDISFNEKGICSHCLRYDNLLPFRVHSLESGKEALDSLVARIKHSGKGKKYDCIIGVSGGVDSTYVAHLTKQLGLKPLAIHFDNGWNSELAVSNIEKTLNKLSIDLYTYVINWPEFKELQKAFLRSSTPDGEVPTDHAINALLFREASKRNIKYIINGMNFRTESMEVPKWSYGHADWRYIKSVNRIHGKGKLREYPKYTLFDTFYYLFVRKIKLVSILNYIPYNKDEAMNLLKKELDWVYYGGKHYESIYTRFYQSYYLPQKFNIDKRIGHYSDLIRSGQISRDKALLELEAPPIDESQAKKDLSFVLKKLSLTQDDFDALLSSPNKTYEDYPNNRKRIVLLKSYLNKLRLSGRMSK